MCGRVVLSLQRERLAAGGDSPLAGEAAELHALVERAIAGTPTSAAGHALQLRLRRAAQGAAPAATPEVRCRHHVGPPRAQARETPRPVAQRQECCLACWRARMRVLPPARRARGACHV